jgi:hypothetical protein
MAEITHWYWVWNEFYGGLQVCKAEDVDNLGEEFTFFRMAVGTNQMEEFCTNGLWASVTNEFGE